MYEMAVTGRTAPHLSPILPQEREGWRQFSNSERSTGSFSFYNEHWAQLSTGPNGTDFGKDLPKLGATTVLAPQILRGGSVKLMAIMHPQLSRAAGYLPLSIIVSLAFLSTTVSADGRGILGLGKWLYKPPCAHACRAVIEDCKILCDSKLSGGPERSSSSTQLHPLDKRHSHGILTMDLCLLRDAAFLRTLALCIAERCPRTGVDSIAEVEKYWEGHLATGTVGNWKLKPIVSYQEALRYAREDLEQAVADGNVVAYAQPGMWLNATSLVRERDWRLLYNGQKYVERNERDHGRNSLAIAISSIFLPIFMSIFRFLPLRPLWYSRLAASLERPLVGRRHRTPIVADLGIMPTRGQSLYLAYLLVTQGLLCVFPLIYLSPNPVATTRGHHYLLVIGDRTGVVSMANFVALFLFASRNNFLLWITNWRHSTFLLLHRWIGYCLILEVAGHSILMYLLHLLYLQDHDTRSKRPPWICGMIATLAFALILPASMLPIRKRVYEFFLITHRVLAVVALLATFLHTNYLFGFTWGYEIWIYVGGGLWFLDRALRVARIVSNGYRTARISVIDEEGERVRADIDGIAAEGHVYLYFPTLSWRFWENHPFSVLSSFSGGTTSRPSDGVNALNLRRTSNMTNWGELNRQVAVHPRTTLLVRGVNGFTKTLVRRLLESPNHRLSLPVLVESNYHANPGIRSLSHCSSLLCIAGGVGITAVIPLIKSFGGVRSRLEWGLRNEALAIALQRELTSLTQGTGMVEVNTSVGKRLKVREIVREELEKDDDVGDLGVVVCGPLPMADDVRNAVAEYGSKAKRGVIFVDESFSW
ncbi:hypothetical protein NMY22_g10838 [Coprinellus aureogranulatus]|nr:hypothetical protein NMY22_g10838 [Coprinellus aureogranulatus]